MNKKILRWALAIFLSLYTLVILSMWFLSVTNTPERMERISERNPELISQLEEVDPDKYGNGYILTAMVTMTIASYWWLYKSYKSPKRG